MKWWLLLAFLFSATLQAEPNTAACTMQFTSVMASKSENSERPTQHWQNVTLPDSWYKRWPQHNGSVWYRIDWNYQPDCGDLALMIDSIVMAGEVFINDERLWQDAHLTEPLSRSWAMARYWQLPSSLLQAGSNTLWVHVVGHAENGGGLGLVTLKSPNALSADFQQQRWHSRTVSLFNLAATTIIGVLAFAIWMVYPKQLVLLSFFIISTLWAVFLACSLSLTTWPFSNSFNLAKAHAFLYFFFLLGFCIFIWQLLKWPIARVMLWIISGFSLLICVAIVMADSWASLKPIGDIGTLIFISTCLYVLIKTLRQRTLENGIIAVCILIILTISVRDILVLIGAIDSRILLVGYTFVLFLFSAAFIIGRSAVNNARQIESFNQVLTEKVEEARAELSVSLNNEYQLALSNLRLTERLQLAHDLHDGLGGQLVRSIIHLEQAPQDANKQQFLATLKLLRNDLRQLLDNETGNDADVPNSPTVWLAPLRYRFTNLFDDVGIQLDWFIATSWNPTPTSAQCLLLARVIEEALTNVLKHSKATVTTVTLETSLSNELILVIVDNGIGFAIEHSKQTNFGIGLNSMTARINRLNGRLEVESQKGQTRICAKLPLTPQ